MKQLLIIPAIAGLGFLSISMNAPDHALPATSNQSAVVSTETPEKPAEFKGGMEALMSFLGSETKYPKSAQELGITGVVYVQFDIDATGKVIDAKIAKSSGNVELDKEALRVVRVMPDWNPAESKGKTVRSEITLPFKFAL